MQEKEAVSHIVSDQIIFCLICLSLWGFLFKTLFIAQYVCVWLVFLDCCRLCDQLLYFFQIGKPWEGPAAAVTWKALVSSKIWFISSSCCYFNSNFSRTAIIASIWFWLDTNLKSQLIILFCSLCDMIIKSWKFDSIIPWFGHTQQRTHICSWVQHAFPATFTH